MRDFIISTESNSDMPKAFLEENGVLVIPHYYTVEEEMYGDGKELSISEFYDAMRSGKKAGTMASNPAVILEKFEEAAKNGKDILHISFSSELSCGCQNIMNGANEIMEKYPDMTIQVVDTLSASLAEGLMMQMALDLKQEGKSITEIAEKLRAHVQNLCVQFTVDDLDFLYRGGRLSKTSAVLGSVIQIKPILYVNPEGKLVALGKTRGRKKSIAALVDNMEERLGSYKDKQIFIGIIHGDCEDDAKYLQSLVQERFGYEHILIQPIGPSIGAHSGPGALGIVFLGDHR